MNKKKRIKITMVWKFIYWFVVWALIFLPAVLIPISLSGFWLTLSRIAGGVMLIYSLFLSSSGGRVLARFAHQEERETIWPDKFTEFGLFGCMRHPMHMGLALFPVSVALLTGRILALCSAGWGVAAALWFVLQIEEKDVLEKFGMRYFEYMQKVPPFSLNPKCLAEGLKIWKHPDKSPE